VSFAGLLRRHAWVAPLALLVLLFLVIGTLRPSTFAIGQINIKVAAAMTLILIATGETIVLMRGGIDLSVGAILSLATAIAATCGDPGAFQSWLWISFILALGAAIGVVNGLIVSVLQLQPFVVTLATWAIVEGTALLVLPSENSGVPRAWVSAAYGSYLGISMAVVLLGLLLVFWAWFSRTRPFAAIRAAGSSERAAFLQGVSLTATNAGAYALSGFFAAAAGVYFAAQTGAGSPTLGPQYILPAIAAAVIGGTSLAGGRATLIGTIAGALILTLIGDVVFLLKLQSYWQPVMSGVILMSVVVLTSLIEVRSPEGSGS
jgi:ribose transport system permease protein